MKVAIKEIIPNPSNPRVIKDDKYQKLLKSIRDFPQMLELRPIVVSDDMIVLGGNMRLRALQELGYKEVPIVKASELTPEQQKEFIIKDNVGYGEWDWAILGNDFDLGELEEWGLDVDINEPKEKKDPEEKELIPYEKIHILISFPPEKFIEIQDKINEITENPWVEYEQTSN